MEHKEENQPKEQILTLNPIMDIKGQRLFQLPFDMKRESVNQKISSIYINMYKAKCLAQLITDIITMAAAAKM